MFFRLRLILLPAAGAILVAILAFNEWSSISKGKEIARKFKEASDLKTFTYVGERTWNDRKLPTYEYDDGGKVREFPTPKKIDLPEDGRVRLGDDPFYKKSEVFNQRPVSLVAVPIHGADSVEAIYAEFRERTVEDDTGKAWLVTLAAVVAGAIGFFLQREIIRGFRKNRPSY